MLWYYAWQCTANNSPKNGDFKGLFNINIATRANKKPSSHLMFDFHVSFGGCLWLILDISDYNHYNSTYCNSLTPIYKKRKASTLHHQLQKGQGSQAFQDLFSNPTIVGHSNLVPPVTGGRHRNPYSARILRSREAAQKCSPHCLLVQISNF